MNNNKVRVLWCGITGKTGKAVYELSKKDNKVEIVAGVCRSDSRFYNYDKLDDIKEEFDVIADFSHRDSFNKVLNYALKVKKPIITGTSKLSEEQLQSILDAANIIPVFRGGNFLFKVKKFIDDVVEYAKICDGNLELIETHYKTKRIPTETSKVIVKRVFEATGKEMAVKTFLEYDELIDDYKVDHLHCRVTFEELPGDILKILVMMKDKKPNGVYDLDKLLKE